MLKYNCEISLPSSILKRVEIFFTQISTLGKKAMLSLFVLLNNAIKYTITQNCHLRFVNHKKKINSPVLSKNKIEFSRCSFVSHSTFENTLQFSSKKFQCDISSKRFKSKSSELETKEFLFESRA